MTDFSTCIKVFHSLALLAIQVNGTPLPQQNELVHGQPPPPPPPPPQQANDLIHGFTPPPPPSIQQSDFIHGVPLPQQQQDHSVDLTHPNKGLPTFAGEKPKKEIIYVLDDKKVAGHDKAPVRSMFIEPFENKRTGEKEAIIITEQSPSSAMLDEHHYHHHHHPVLMAVEEPLKKNDQQHSKHHHGQDRFNDDEDDGEYDDKDDYYDDDDDDDNYAQDRDDRFNPSVYLKSKQHHLGNP